MRHGLARSALAAILDGEGFGPRALTILQVARVSDAEVLPPALVDRLLDAACALPADPPGDSAASLGGLVLPEDDLACAEQCTGLLSEHPQHVGLGLAQIHGLVELWPHASRRERLQLRRLWYRSLVTLTAPEGSYATRQDLREWQSRQPTIHDDETPTACAIAGMMDRSEPDSAYHLLAAQLGPNTQVGKLCCVLGVLAQRILLHRFDRHGLVQNALLGSCALGQLVDRMPLGNALVLLSQLGHRIWWCRHRAGLTDLEPGNLDREMSLGEAVRGADATAAQRAARIAAGDRDRFWSNVSELLGDQLDSHNPHWPRALSAIDAVAARAHGNPPGPDDAAALGTALATVTWLSPACRGV